MRFYETTPQHDLTYSDVFLVPERSSVASRLAVSLAPDDGTGATIPIVSANMNSVTGARLAATLARRGGLGVLPQDLHAADLHASIRTVKQQPVEYDAAVILGPGDTVASALALLPPAVGQAIVLQDEDGTYLGAIAAETLATAMPHAPLGDLLGRPVTTVDASELRGARAAFDLMVAAGLAFAPVLKDGQVDGMLSRTGALRSTLYEPALDAHGRLRVAAAIGINGDVASKARSIVAAGADVVVIDTAHGHQNAMIRAIEVVARLDLGVPIVAGNVVTAAAVRDLVAAGATIVKVGVGPGAMCTTRMMTAVGRPQFSAVLET
ncbi:MAG: IMP dehydrogenase, partial [Rhodoglobus sp.]